MVFIDVYQIYSYLLKLKLNLSIGPQIAIIKTLSMVTKINDFTLSKKI